MNWLLVPATCLYLYNLTIYGKFQTNLSDTHFLTKIGDHVCKMYALGYLCKIRISNLSLVKYIMIIFSWYYNQASELVLKWDEVSDKIQHQILCIYKHILDRVPMTLYNPYKPFTVFFLQLTFENDHLTNTIYYISVRMSMAMLEYYVYPVMGDMNNP